MSYLDFVGRDGIQYNVVIGIGSDYWADAMPDHDPGNLIQLARTGLVGTVDVPSPTVDPLRSSVSASTITFNLLDVGGVVSAWYGANNNALYGAITQVWVGAIGQGQSFPADYQLLGTCNIDDPSFSAGSWQFQGLDVIQKAIIPMYGQGVQIPAAMTAAQTSVAAVYNAAFQNTGFLKIDSEIMSYTSVTGNSLIGYTFNGLARGLFGSTAATHSAAVIAYPMDQVTGNPVLLALEFLISTGVSGANGVYDVLKSGAAFPAALVDVAAFVSVAGQFTNSFTVYPSNVTNVLDYVCTLLQSINVRIISKNGLISCFWVDNFNTAAFILTMDETMINQTPTSAIDATQLVTTVVYNWNWLPGSNTYQNQSTYTNAESVAKYGARAPLVINVAAQVVAGPATFYDVYAKNFLRRFGNPVATVSLQTSRAAAVARSGDVVLMIHSKFPQPGGGLGHNAFMSVLDLDIDPKTGIIGFDLQYPSFSGYKIGSIAPSPFVLAPGIDPRNLSGLTIFVDPDTISQADGSAVASITDSIQGLVFANGTGGQQPTIKNGLANGHNVLRFSAAASQQLTANITRANVYSATEATFFVVSRETGAQGAGSIQNTLVYDINTRVGLYGQLNFSSFVNQYLFDYVLADRLIATGPSTFDGNFHVYMADRDASRNQRVVVDSTVLATNQGADDINLAGTSILQIGSDNSGDFLDGDVACFLYFNRKLTDAEIAGVNAWIQNRYFATSEPFTQQSFPVVAGNGIFYQPGFVVRLWRGSTYTSDPVNSIQSIVGDTITVTTPWATPLDSQVRLKFADYSDCTPTQQELYAFVAADFLALYAYDPTDVQQLVNAYDATDTAQQVIARSPSPQLADGSNPFQVVP